MEDKIIVVTIFVLYGLLASFRPDLIGKFQVWSNKVILGATFKPSKKTFAYYRAIGIFFLIMAFMVFFIG